MSAVGDARAEVQRALGKEAAELLPYVASVSTPGEATNAGDGTFTETPTALEGVPCDYEPLSSFERITGGAVTGQADYALEFPKFWDGEPLTIPANATVDVEETGAELAKSFEVVGPLPSSSVWKQRVAATLRG